MVQHDLFEGNPNGWNAYVAELQKKVAWFGEGKSKSDTGKENRHY